MKTKKSLKNEANSRKDVGMKNMLNISSTKVRKIPQEEILIKFFFLNTETARGAALALNMQRDDFSSQIHKWVKRGILMVAFRAYDWRTNRIANFYTSNPVYMKSLQSNQPKQLSFLDMEGFLPSKDVCENIPNRNLIGGMSGHMEGSKAFNRYRSVDTDLLKKGE